MKSETWLILADIHYPVFHKPTFEAALDFAQRNKVAGVILLGDQLDNSVISSYNERKPLFKPAGQYAADTEGFDREILKPLESALHRNAKKVWIIGNHDAREARLVEEHQELQGSVERPILLNLVGRGWTVIPEGNAFQKGKLSFAHGEHFGTQYYTRRAVDTFCGNVCFGHHHSLQTYTRVLARDPSQKWTATCLPIVGDTSPQYLKNRPTNWVNGVGIAEFLPDGSFNLYPVVTTNGRFCYGGAIYGASRSHRRQYR